MQVPSLGQEDLLEDGMATHSSILAWRIPMDRGTWWATVHGVTQRWTQLKRLSTHPMKILLGLEHRSGSGNHAFFPHKMFFTLLKQVLMFRNQI